MALKSLVTIKITRITKKSCILVLFLTFFFLTQTTKAKQAKNLYYHILQTIMGIYKTKQKTHSWKTELFSLDKKALSCNFPFIKMYFHN